AESITSASQNLAMMANPTTNRPSAPMTPGAPNHSVTHTGRPVRPIATPVLTAVIAVPAAISHQPNALSGVRTDTPTTITIAASTASVTRARVAIVTGSATAVPRSAAHAAR